MSRRPSTSQPLFIFPASRGKEELGSVLKKRIDEIASILPDAWSPPHEELASIHFSAVRNNQRITACLMKDLEGHNVAPKLYSFIACDILDGEKPLYVINLSAPQIDIAREPSFAHDLANTLRHLIVIDHEDLDAIDGFPARTSDESPFCRMSQIMLSAFYSQIPQEHRKDADQDLWAWHKVEINSWSIEVSSKLNARARFQDNPKPEILALLPAMTIAKSEKSDGIIMLDHPHCIPNDMQHDAMRSLQSIAALEAFSKRYAHG